MGLQIRSDAGDGRADGDWGVSEESFRDLAESSPVGIYVVQGNAFRYVNSKFAEIHGYTVEDMIGRISIQDLAHPDDWPALEASILEGVQGNLKTYYAELRARQKSGKVIHVEVYAALTSILGKPAMIGTTMDISGRKEMENVLKNSHAALERLVALRTEDLEKANRKLEEEIIANHHVREAVVRAKQEWERTFDSVSDLICVMDSGHHIIRLNRAMADKMGLSPHEAVGTRCHELIHGTKEPPPPCPYLLLKADGQEHTSEIYVGNWSGTYDLTVFPLHDESGQMTGCVHIGRDVTKRKQQQDCLEHTVRERTAELWKKNRTLSTEIAERQRVESALRQKAEELKSHSLKLEELNVALKVILEQRDADKADLEEKVLSNIKHLLQPHLDSLKMKRLEPECATTLEMLETNLCKLTSSFSRKLTGQYLNLTPAEMRVADLVKEGKSIKEIAERLSVSHFTVDLHRHNIRKKLGLTSRKINLQAYLLSLS